MRVHPFAAGPGCFSELLKQCKAQIKPVLAHLIFLLLTCEAFVYEAEVLGRYEKQAIFTPSQIGLGMFILDSGAAQATVGFFIVFCCYCQIKKST